MSAEMLAKERRLICCVHVYTGRWEALSDSQDAGQAETREASIDR